MMKRIAVCLVLVFSLYSSLAGAVSCTVDSTKVVNLGEYKQISVSCTGITGSTTVTVKAVGYNAECISVDRTQDTLTATETSKLFTIQALSMKCNPYLSDRTITWQFSASDGSNVPSKTTVVTIQSPISISASFTNSTYYAEPSGEVTIILEVSTAASQDITDIFVDTSQSDVVLDNKTIAKIAASQGERTQQVSWKITAPEEEGRYTLKAVVTSQNADSDTATATLEVKRAETTTTLEEEAPGGGGGVPIATEIRPRVVYLFDRLVPGAAKIMRIQKEEIGIREIEISVKNQVNNVRITVTKLEGKPASVVHEVSGKVYQYVEITAENLGEESVSQAKIRFEVDTSWINENRIDKHTVALYRYANDTWQKLNTTMINETESYVTYEAVTPGFSVFAISGETVKETTTTVTTTTTSTTLPEEVTTTTITTTTLPSTTTTLPEEEVGGIDILIIALCIVVGAVLVVGYWKRREIAEALRRLRKK